MKLKIVCVALLLVPTSMTSGQELKPKFGDIGGVFYTEVAEDREACRQAIKNKIALCSQNTSFVSNTMDRKYPGCLPIFRDQSRGCTDHFRSEAYKCQGSGPVRIEDFTGFACAVTATVVEEGADDREEMGRAVKTGKSSKCKSGFISFCKSMMGRPTLTESNRRRCQEAMNRC